MKIINKFLKLFGFRKYNFKCIYKSELISKFKLNTPISRYITKSNLISRIPNHNGLPILIIQMNKIHCTLECFLDDGNNLPFKIYDYRDTNFKRIDERKILQLFLNTIEKHPGYTISNEEEHEIILDHAIYITPDEYLDDKKGGSRKIFYTDDKRLYLKYFNKDRNTNQKYFLNMIVNDKKLTMHKYLIFLNKLNKYPEIFIKMDE